MQVQQLKCPNCGAQMRAVNNIPEVYCAYCGSHFTRTEKEVSKNNSQQTPQPQIVYVKDNRVVPPRPRVHGCLLIFLLVMYFVPGVIYYIYVTNQQKIWDEQYGG